MTCTLELGISSSTKNRCLIPDSVRYSDPLEARTNCSFTLVLPTSDITYAPVPGNPVYLANASSTFFGGQVENVNEEIIPFSSYTKYNVSCVDYTQICDRRLCSKSYTSSGYDADIIVDIITNFLNDEGITYNHVTTGITIPELNLNYISVTAALDEISRQTGRDWYIDASKDMHYFARSEKNAPIEINSTSDNWRKLGVKRSREKYRNTEYLQGVYNSVLTTEYFKGDGYTQSFTLSYGVLSVPTIYVNATTKSVGIRDVETGKDFLWSKESNIITQPSTDVAIASTDYLRVAYTGIFSVTARTQDDEEITARKAIEGGSGIYEVSDQGTKVYDGNAALKSANSYISKYGKMPDFVTFETDEDGLRSGQLIWIELTAHNLADYYYITNVTARDVGMALMRYTVTAVSGQERGGWVTFFKGLTLTEAERTSTPYTALPILYGRKYEGNIDVYMHAAVTQTIIVGYFVDDPACLVGTATVS